MKYKKTASPGWIVQIDDLGNVSQSFTAKNKPGLWTEYEAWKKAGNEIEPYETAEEIAAREAKEAEQALEAQYERCKQILKDTDHLVSNDTDYPEHLGANKAYRVKIKEIMRSGVPQEIPDRKTVVNY